MNILFVAPEAAPYYRTGGVADVVYGLAKSLSIKGHDVRIIVPRYRSIMQDTKMVRVLSDLNVSVGAYPRAADLWKIDGKPKFYFVDQDFYFGRDDYYGYLDDYERFIFFTRFVLEMLKSNEFAKQENWFPKIIQGYDWVSGLIPGWLPVYRNDPKDTHFKDVRFSLFIHNIRRLGRFNSRALLLAEQETTGFYKEIKEESDQINFLGRGLLFADKVITVNPNYNLPENPLPESADPIRDILLQRLKENSLHGIPSGIDEDEYNPETDPALASVNDEKITDENNDTDGHIGYHNFKPSEIDQRHKNKLALQKELGFEQNPDIPMLGMVGRLIPENGFDLLTTIESQRKELGEIQLTILAEPGEMDYKGTVQKWEAEQNHEKPWIKYRSSFDNQLSRRIYAGCDILLIPAKEYPNGIHHLIAMHYGAIPVARHTGALADTIADYQPGMKFRQFSGKGLGIGFKFNDFTGTAFLEALKTALQTYSNEKENWLKLQIFNMGERFSWALSADEYYDLFEEALKAAPRPVLQGTDLILGQQDRLLQALMEIGNLPGLGTRNSGKILKQAARLVRWVLGCDAVFVRGQKKRLQLSADASNQYEDGIVEHSLDIDRQAPAPEDSKVIELLKQSTNNTWKHLGDVDLEGICQTINGLVKKGIDDAADQNIDDIAHQQKWKAGWTVPLLAHGRLLGWIDVLFTDVPNDTAWVVSTLTTLANAFGLRLDTIRLTDETDLISEMGNDFFQTKSVDDVNSLACAWVNKLIPETSAWIFPVREQKVEISAGFAGIENFKRLSRLVLQSGNMEYYADWNDAPRGNDKRRLYRSILAIPIFPHANYEKDASPKSSKTEYLLIVASAHQAAFTRDDEQMLSQHLIPLTQSALRRAQWLENRDQDLVMQFRKLANSLVAGVEFNSMLEQVVNTFAEALEVRAAALYLINNETGMLDIKAATGYQRKFLEKKVSYRIGQGLTGWIAENQKTVKANSLVELHNLAGWSGDFNRQYDVSEPNAFLGLPLVINEKGKPNHVIGVLKVEDRLPTHPKTVFSDEDVRLAEMLAIVIASVIYNAQQTDNRLRELSDGLRLLSTSLAGSLDTHTLMKDIVTTISQVLHVDAATLFLSDEAHTRLTIQAAYGYQEPMLTAKTFYYWGEGVTGRIAETNQPFQANDLRTLRDKGGSAQGKYDHLYGGKRPDSFYGLPLNVSGKEKAIGVLKVESLNPRPFTSEDVLLIEMMGNVIAAVVYNAKQSEDRLGVLSDGLRQLSKSLAGSPDAQTLMNNFVKTIAEVVHVDAATLFLSDEEHTRLTIQAACGYQEPLLSVRAFYLWGEGVTGRIAQTNQPFQANDLRTLRDKGGSAQGKYDHLYGGKRPDSFYGLPLNVSGQEKAIGVLKVESLIPRPFTNEDVLLIEMMANVIATVVYNAQLEQSRLVDLIKQMGSLASPNSYAAEEMLRDYAHSPEVRAREALARSLTLLIGDDPQRAYDEALALLRNNADLEIFSRMAQVAREPIRNFFELLNTAAHTEAVQANRLEQVFDISYHWYALQSTPDEKTFDQIAERFVAAFSRECKAEIIKQSRHGDWAGFLLNTEVSFKGTYLPKSFVVAIHRYGDLTDEKETKDLITILRSLRDNKRVNDAVLIPVLGSEKEINQTQSILRIRLKQIHGIDSILLNIEDIRNITGDTRPEIKLQHHILGKIGLEKIIPYRQEGPTGDMLFFGREAILTQICSNIKQTNYAVIGTRRIGKTSLLRQLHLFRLPEIQCRSILMDVSTFDSIQTFKNANIPSWNPKAPANAPERIGELLEGNIPDDMPLVLLLDEVDKLVANDTQWEVFNQLRGRANEDKLRFVVCGERTLNEALHTSSSPLFNSKNQIILGPLNIQAVSELVVEPMRQLDITLVDKDKVVQKIFDFTSGHPNVVQRLCIRLIEYLNTHDTRQISVDTVDIILKTPAFIETDFLETYLSKATVLEHLCALVMAANKSANTLTSIEKQLHKENVNASLNQIEAALDRLVKLRSLLERTTEIKYDFRVKAFPMIVAKSKRLSEWIALRREIFDKAGDIAPEDAPKELKGKLW